MSIDPVLRRQQRQQRPLYVKIAEHIIVLVIFAVMGVLILAALLALGWGLASTIISGGILAYVGTRPPVYPFERKLYPSIDKLMQDAVVIFRNMFLSTTLGIGVSAAIGVGTLGRPWGIGLVVTAILIFLFDHPCLRRRSHSTTSSR